jgi:uncharacterized protein (DUF169 family)
MTKSDSGINFNSENNDIDKNNARIILKNNQYISEELKKILKLKNSPVAIKFVRNKGELVKNIPKINEKIRHCEMVKKASNGEVFYGSSKEQLCKGGSSSLGLEEVPKNMKTGEFYYNLGRFKSIGSAKRTLDLIPKIKFKNYALIYAPLEKANFEADIIILIVNPKKAMLVSQAIVYTLGGRVNSNFAGIQSVCSDAVAGPFNTKETNFTLGCNGSRKFAKIQDEELIIGLNSENINCLITALNSIK